MVVLVVVSGERGVGGVCGVCGVCNGVRGVNGVEGVAGVGGVLTFLSTGFVLRRGLKKSANVFILVCFALLCLCVMLNVECAASVVCFVCCCFCLLSMLVWPRAQIFQNFHPK